MNGGKIKPKKIKKEKITYKERKQDNDNRTV